MRAPRRYEPVAPRPRVDALVEGGGVRPYEAWVPKELCLTPERLAEIRQEVTARFTPGTSPADWAAGCSDAMFLTYLDPDFSRAVPHQPELTQAVTRTVSNYLDREEGVTMVNFGVDGSLDSYEVPGLVVGYMAATGDALKHYPRWEEFRNHYLAEATASIASSDNHASFSGVPQVTEIIQLDHTTRNQLLELQVDQRLQQLLSSLRLEGPLSRLKIVCALKLLCGQADPSLLGPVDFKNMRQAAYAHEERLGRPPGMSLYRAAQAAIIFAPHVYYCGPGQIRLWEESESVASPIPPRDNF